MAASCFLSVMARKPTSRGKGFQSDSIVPDYQTAVALPPACARPGTVPVHLIRRWRSEAVWSHCGVSIIRGDSGWPFSHVSHLSPAPGSVSGGGVQIGSLLRDVEWCSFFPGCGYRGWEDLQQEPFLFLLLSNSGKTWPA